MNPIDEFTATTATVVDPIDYLTDREVLLAIYKSQRRVEQQVAETIAELQERIAKLKENPMFAMLDL